MLRACTTLLIAYALGFAALIVIAAISDMPVVSTLCSTLIYGSFDEIVALIVWGLLFAFMTLSPVPLITMVTSAVILRRLTEMT